MSEILANLQRGESRKVVYDKLAESTSTSLSNIVTLNGKLSDYRYIMLCAEYPNNSATTVVTNSTIYPVEMVKDMASALFYGFSDTVSGTNVLTTRFKYVSDTQAALSISNNQYLKAVLYGIK